LKEDFKIFIGTKILNRKIRGKTRNVRVCNINDAKKVGIVYNADYVISYELIKNLTKNLSDKGIKVDALGYVQSKKLIDHYLFRKGFDFFTKSQLNWYNKPIDRSVTDFIEKPFDILINLNLEKSYPIDYIVAMSNATFKVGRLFKGVNYIDLMIDIEKEKETMLDLQEEIKNDKKSEGKQMAFETEVKSKIEIEIQLNFLINQIIHYLSIIKSS